MNKTKSAPKSFQKNSQGSASQSHSKKFNERSLGDKSSRFQENKNKDQKFGKKTPHFNQPQERQFNQGEERRFQDKARGNAGRNTDRNTDRFNDKKAGRNFQERPQRTERQATVTNLDLRKANGESGSVKVLVKGSQEVVAEKKTGALSPRAPEKIRKNRAEEMKVYGENACNALFSQRPESIVRVWATVEMAHKVGAMFSYLASQKKVYHVVDAEELALVSGTEHHGGICMLVKKARPFTLSGYLSIARQRDCVLVLDGVRNAHNIGGIVRTCAVYGVKSIVVEDSELLNSSSAMRVAEGGMEYVHALENLDVENSLAQLRQAGYQIVHCTLDKQAPTLAKLAPAQKVAFVLSESSSLALAQEQDQCVQLSPFNPLKHGLNVAVATGVLLAHWLAS